MTPEEKLALDVKDFWRICEGLEVFSNLDPKGYMERFKTHKEDAFCEITDYTGKGKQHCTRDALDAILDLAERHQESLPIPDDYSVDAIKEGIKTTFIKVWVEESEAQTTDEQAITRILTEAVAFAKENHVERTYHFPCVIFPTKKAIRFQMLPVTFASAAVLPESLAQELSKYGDEAEQMRQSASDFEKSCQQYGWLASVTIPPCSPEPAKRRAEVAISTALNLLRLVFGIPHGRDMRLAHTAPTIPNHSHYAIFREGKLRIAWSRSMSGAAVPDDALQQLDSDAMGPFRAYGAQLLRTTVAGKRSEIAERVIDALTWYGEAAFESAPGTRIVNFVAALERLTTTEKFGTHLFCSRVALLACPDSNDFEKTYWQAFEAYMARSAVMHGWYSPSNPTFRKTLDSAYAITRQALFSALEIHRLLVINKKEPPTIQSLRNFFNSEQSKKAKELLRLRKEAEKKEKELRRRYAF